MANTKNAQTTQPGGDAPPRVNWRAMHHQPSVRFTINGNNIVAKQNTHQLNQTPIAFAIHAKHDQFTLQRQGAQQ